MRTNRILSAALVACGAIGLSTAAHATNGYQLIGVGAYQKGMGGAVAANPGSAMSAITNPAGMAAIGDRADFSMEAFMPKRTADFSNNSAQGGEKEDSEAGLYGIPAIGWTAPVADGSDFYFGGGMYGTSGLGVDYGKTIFGGNPFAGGPVPGGFGTGNYGTQTAFDGFSNIQFWQMAPTLAWSMNDQLKLGASLNVDYQSVAFDQRLTDQNDNQIMNFRLGRTAQSLGYGVSLGALFKINSMFQVGAYYKSEQMFGDMEYQLRANDILNFPDGNGGLVTSTGGTYKMDLDFPQQFAAGLKFTPMDTLTVSADVKWINWSATMDELEVTGDFNSGNYGGGGPTNQNAALDPGWDDQIVYALGVDYQVMKDLNLRAGYNYAEAPIEKDDVFSNLLLPAMTEQHLTLGATYRLNNHWDLSFAYMKAFNNSVTGKGDIPQSYQNLGFAADSNAEINLEETSYTLNIGYKF